MTWIEDIIVFEQFRLSFVLVGVVGFFFLLFLYFYLYRFYRLTAYKPQKKGIETLPPVTIIVIVNDQIEYLKTGLIKLLDQSYPNDFQIVIVNDSPKTDETIRYLGNLSESYKDRLYITTIDRNEFKHTKRLAYTIGIKAAKYEHILFTDPKSEVISDKWLEKMMTGYAGRDIVIGNCGVAFKKGIKNAVFRTINTYDSMMGLSAAVCGRPFRGTMANMGFTAPLFFKTGGYRFHQRLNTGEQDLFLQQIAKKGDSEVVLAKTATVFQDMSEYGWTKWFHERTFKAYTTRFYSASRSFYLTLVPLSALLFWLAATGALVLNFEMWHYIVPMIFLREIVIVLILIRFSKRTGTKAPLVTYPLFDIFGFIYTIPLFLSRKLKPSRDLWI